MTELPEAEALVATLLAQMRADVTPQTALVGIHTGGAWLAQRLHAELEIREPLGSMDVAFYRDDYASRALSAKTRRSEIPFDVEGRRVIIVDDVLYTGRTTRAALNELFDYGRPASVDLAVLVDRGGRELPIEARYCAYRLSRPLEPNRSLQLDRDEQGKFSLRLIEAK